MSTVRMMVSLPAPIERAASITPGSTGTRFCSTRREVAKLHGCQEDDERNRAHDVDDDVKDAVDDRVLEQVAGAGAIEHHAEDQAEESADDEGDEHHGQGLANGFEQ